MKRLNLYYGSALYAKQLHNKSINLPKRAEFLKAFSVHINFVEKKIFLLEKKGTSTTTN